MKGFQFVLPLPEQQMKPVPKFTVLTLLMGLLTMLTTQAQDNIVFKNGSEIQAKVLELSPGQIKYRRQDNPEGPIYTTGTADVLFIKYANGTKDVLGSAGNATPSRNRLVAPTPLVGTAPSQAAPTLDGLRYHSRLFSRGFVDGNDQPLSGSAVRSILVDHHSALRAYAHGQHLRRWGYVTGGASLLLVASGAAIAIADGIGGGDGKRREGQTNPVTDPTDPDESTRTQGERNGHRGDGIATTGYALAGGGLLLGVAALLLDHRATMQFRRAAGLYNNRPTTSLRIGPSQRGIGAGVVLSF